MRLSQRQNGISSSMSLCLPPAPATAGLRSRGVAVGPAERESPSAPLRHRRDRASSVPSRSPAARPRSRGTRSWPSLSCHLPRPQRAFEVNLRAFLEHAGDLGEALAETRRHLVSSRRSPVALSRQLSEVADPEAHDRGDCPGSGAHPVPPTKITLLTLPAIDLLHTLSVSPSPRDHPRFAAAARHARLVPVKPRPKTVAWRNCLGLFFYTSFPAMQPLRRGNAVRTVHDIRTRPAPVYRYDRPAHQRGVPRRPSVAAILLEMHRHIIAGAALALAFAISPAFAADTPTSCCDDPTARAAMDRI